MKEITNKAYGATDERGRLDTLLDRVLSTRAIPNGVFDNSLLDSILTTNFVFKTIVAGTAGLNFQYFSLLGKFLKSLAVELARIIAEKS